MDVSIVVPVYNGEKTIRSCLASLQDQSFKGGMEVIVVDDGSTDKTRAIVKEFKNVKLLSQDHQGPAKARNLGAKKARGEIIVFTDSDCTADQKMVEGLVKACREKGVAGVQGGYRTRQEELMARFIQAEIEERYKLMKKNRFIDFIGTYCCAYRRDVFLKEGGFDEGFPLASGEDTEFSFKLSEKGHRLIFRPEAFSYHFHPTSLVKYLKTKFFRAFYRVKLYRLHKRKMVKDSYTPQGLKLQVALSYAFFAGLVGFIAWPSALSLAAAFASLAAILALALPSIVFMFKKDWRLGLSSPAIILSRTIVFGLGFAGGLLGLKK
jgi:glycosyltransferase involved in cell wall biosynthesis